MEEDGLGLATHPEKHFLGSQAHHKKLLPPMSPRGALGKPVSPAGVPQNVQCSYKAWPVTGSASSLDIGSQIFEMGYWTW